MPWKIAALCRRAGRGGHAGLRAAAGADRTAATGTRCRRSMATRSSAWPAARSSLDMEGRVVHTWPVGHQPAAARQRPPRGREPKTTPAASRDSRKWTGTARRSGSTPRSAGRLRAAPRLGADLQQEAQRARRRSTSPTSRSPTSRRSRPVPTRERPVSRRPDGRRRRGGHAGQRRVGVVVLRPRRAGRRRDEGELRGRRQDDRRPPGPHQHQHAGPAAAGATGCT